MSSSRKRKSGKNTYQELIDRVGLEEARRIVREKAQAYRDAHKDEMNAKLREQRKSRTRQLRQAARKWQEGNRERLREYAREYYAKNREKIRARGSEYQKANPEKNSARNRLRAAITNGKIIRPTFCDVCKKEGGIEAHHADYSKPYEVDWLCRSCHGHLHRLSDKHERAPKRGSQLLETGMAEGSGKDAANKHEHVVAQAKAEVPEVMGPEEAAEVRRVRRAMLDEADDPALQERRAWAEKNREHLREYGRSYYAKNKEKIKKASAKNYRNDPQKWLARITAARAVKKGTLVRSEQCAWCDASPVRTEAHHEDYSKPLKVVWICRKCHRRWTALEKKKAATQYGGAPPPDSPG